MDAGFVRETLSEGFDGVLHFAALSLVGESVEQPEIYYRNNVCGTLNLLEAMREAGTGRLVFSSTAAVYGEPEEAPRSRPRPCPPTLRAPSSPWTGSSAQCAGLVGWLRRASATSTWRGRAGGSGRRTIPRRT